MRHLLASTLVLFLAAALLEYRKLMARKQYRDIVVSALFLTAGITLGLLRILHVNIPYLMPAIKKVVQPLAQALS